MAALDALFLVAAAVLLLAGMAKVHRPAPTARALADAGWPASDAIVRGLGGVEILVGLAALAVGGRIAATALGAAYLGVTAVAWRQRRAGADCGCFGASTAPVSALHVAVNLLAVAVAGLAVVLPPAGIAATTIAGPWVAATTLGALAVTVALVRAVLTQLPDLQAARSLHAVEVEA
jgi:hypothetical protein